MGFWSRFKKEATYRIVELEKPVPRMSDQDATNIASLEHHPGLESLLNRLRLQRATLEATLKVGEHKDLFAVYNLQNGIKWASWLEKQINQFVGKKEALSRGALDLERKEFERIAEALQIVGRTE